MKFKTQLTAKLLASNLPAEEVNLLPASYQQLGEICFLKLNTKLHKHKKIIGKAVLELHPQFKAVCLKKNISGEFRKPEVEAIAGSLPNDILIKENNCVFRFNPKEIMYSQGNHQEKKRLIADVKGNEIIVDMFAGIGYFSIPIAKTHRDAVVYAIEKNAGAFRYLEENIRLNYLPNVIPVFGDCGKAGPKIPKADRVVMGLIPSCKNFISAAARIAKPDAIIHYHGLAKEKKEYALLNDFKDFKVRLLKTTIIKGYKPHVNHVVLDIKFI
ncbi:MAG: class I SAM-dependent methyltransferase family protein [DPANN group archaeon]|nr:class I SAM-dependent methyltransferase family protein [DPANN group archaeon]